MTIYRGQDCVMSIYEDEEEIPAGIVDDVEIEISKDVEELRGMGSTKRQDAQKVLTEVPISFIINEIDKEDIKKIINYDDEKEELDDSSSVKQFKIEGEFQSSDSSSSIIIIVNDVYLDSIPISVSRDEWLETELNGVGRDIEIK